MMKYIFIFLFIFPSLLFSDTVELRSGKIFQNVKAKILKTSVEFDSEGSHQNFPKSSVKSIRLKPVVLKPPVTKEEVSEYEKEKVRVAESLQNADWPEGSPFIVTVKAGIKDLAGNKSTAPYSILFSTGSRTVSSECTYDAGVFENCLYK